MSSGGSIFAKSDSFSTLIDEPSADITYVGKARLGAAPSDASWQIFRISVTGTVTSIQYADANLKFDNVWNSRASLVYS